MSEDFLWWFPNEGFRPAKFANDYIGPRMDCPLIVKAEDQVYLAKFDPLMGLQSEWLSEAIQKAQTGDKAPAYTETPEGREWASVWRPIEPWHPGPSYPCHCVEVPPINPPIDPAPVPIPASAGLLLLGIAAFAMLRKRRKANA